MYRNQSGPQIRLAVLAFTLSLAFTSARSDEIEIADVSKIVRKYFPADASGGMAVLVTKDSAIIHSKGYGVSNGTDPITPDTPMPLASITKQFAAMCAAMLIEDGKLKLTDKVSAYLPDVRIERDQRELLVQDLLWHTSGLPNFINAKEKVTIQEFKAKHDLKSLNNKTHAQWLTTMPLRRKPGTEFEYTNSGYVLLARIVEVIAEKPFHEFQQQRIFDVLKMKHTSASRSFNGSGMMSTSVSDYAKWDCALWQQSLLDDETSALLLKSGRLDDGTPVGYGFGWHVEGAGIAPTEVWHLGSGSLKSKSRNIVVRDMENRITAAVFVRENLSFTRAVRGRFAREIVDCVRNTGQEKSDDDRPSTLRTLVLQEIESIRRSKRPSRSMGELRRGSLHHPAVLKAPEGLGYYLAHPSRGSNFGSDRMVFGLMTLGVHLREALGDHPDNRLRVHDISVNTGGPIARHINHQMGLDVDIAFYATDLKGNAASSMLKSYGADGKSIDGKHRFDEGRNWQTVSGILSNEFFGEIRAILVADSLKSRLLAHAAAQLEIARATDKSEAAILEDMIGRAKRLMRQPASSPHDNHFHLSLSL